MAYSPSNLKSDVYLILAWSICLPALVVWPFLSAMPAFTLLGDGLSTLTILFNVLMLLTGFWSVAAAYVAYVFARTNTAREERRMGSQRGLLLGAYALAWTGLYIIVALSTR